MCLAEQTSFSQKHEKEELSSPYEPQMIGLTRTCWQFYDRGRLLKNFASSIEDKVVVGGDEGERDGERSAKFFGRNVAVRIPFVAPLNLGLLEPQAAFQPRFKGQSQKYISGVIAASRCRANEGTMRPSRNLTASRGRCRLRQNLE